MAGPAGFAPSFSEVRILVFTVFYIKKWLDRQDSIRRTNPRFSSVSERDMAGPAGFKPANAGTKTQCLTAWRRSNINYSITISLPRQNFTKAGKNDIICNHPLTVSILNREEQKWMLVL